MKKVSKIMSALLALVMCLSLLPMSAFAKGYDPNDDGQDKVQTGLEKDDHKPYTPTELDEGNPSYKGYDVITDKIVDKVDEDAADKDAAKEAADALNKVTNGQQEQIGSADETIQNANDLLGELDALVNTTGKFEAQTGKDTLTTTDADGEEIASVEIDKIVTGDDGKVVVDQAQNADGEPEVVVGEDGKPVGLQDFVKEQSGVISQQAANAETAAGEAAKALADAKAAAQARNQGALDEAKKAAKNAYLDANEAAVNASKTYAEAEAAVEAALAKYEELVGKDQTNAKEIETALKEAQTALNNAQKALEDAKALKDEAAKRRDYAMLYNAMADSVTTEYKVPKTAPEKPVEPVKTADETDEDFAKRTAEYAEKLADYNAYEAKVALAALDPAAEDYAEKYAEYEAVIELAMLYKLDRIAKTCGTMSQDEMMRTVSDIIVTGFDGYKAGYIGFDGLDNAWRKYSDWLKKNGEGTEFDQAYKAAQEAVKQMEYNKDIEPNGKNADPNGYAVIAGTDLLYKVYFYTLQESIKDALDVSGIPVKAKEQLGKVQAGLKDYLKAEEFLAKSKAGEEATFSYTDGRNNEVTIQYTADKITIDGQEYTPDNYPKSDAVSWTAFSAAVRAKVQTKMADQLDSAYQLVFKDQVGVAKKTLYEALQDANKAIDYSEAKTLETYMGLLQYELQARAQNMRYAAELEQYQTVLDNSDVTETLLSLYNFGIPAVKELFKEQVGSLTPEEKEAMKQYGGMVGLLVALADDPMLSDEMAKAVLGFRDELKNGRNDVVGELVIVYQVVAKHAQAKQAEAAEAAAVAKAATDAYDKALQDVADAQARLDTLLKQVEAGKTQFAKAVEDAQQKLNAANTALNTAKTNKESAETAQQEAQTAYEEAVKLTIEIINNGSGNGNNNGNGIFDFGDLTTIDDEAVPLASGPVTRAEFIDYLWRHEGEPASDGVCTFTDVAADHEFILALAWAEQNGLVEANEDGTFEPDELVTVKAVRDILDNFAQVFGTNVVAADDLTTLTGEEDEAVLNCDEVLAEFFGEEYTPAEAEDDIAA